MVRCLLKEPPQGTGAGSTCFSTRRFQSCLSLDGKGWNTGPQVSTEIHVTRSLVQLWVLGKEIFVANKCYCSFSWVAGTRPGGSGQLRALKDQVRL